MVQMKQGQEYKRRDGAKVTQSNDGDDGVWAFGDERSESDTHKQTFDTIDGKPDCASITMKEIDNA